MKKPKYNTDTSNACYYVMPILVMSLLFSMSLLYMFHDVYNVLMITYLIKNRVML